MLANREIKTRLEKAFPMKQAVALADVFIEFKGDLVKAGDFNELKNIVKELAEAQKRTEVKMEELAGAQKRTEGRMEELAEAQKRTEECVKDLVGAQKQTDKHMKELAGAQKRTEVKMEELAEAQKRTEEYVKDLAGAQKQTDEHVKELAGAQKRTEGHLEELAGAQKRTDEELVLFRRTFTSQIGGLGARWGMMTESSFRNAMEGILSEIGFKAERFLAKDKKGIVFGYPAEVELDVVVKNGKTLVIEIKSSVSRADAASFDKKVSFYEKETRRKANRKIIVSPYTEPAAHDAAKRLGIEIFTDINDPAL